jgi:glucosyl-3-phosphoglycerate phosphatase
MVSGSFQSESARGASKVSGSGAAVPAQEQPSRRIFLVRHGRTSLNAAGVLRGRLNPELDATGVAEATAVADAIGHSGLALVVSSPLRRAVDTAAQIGARTGIGVETDERLVDRDYGVWAGQPKSDVIARWGSLDAAPGVEPSAEVLARALDAFNDVARRTDAGSAAIVTHDALLQLLLPALDPRLERVDPLPQETGCFNVVEKSGERWLAASVNVCPITQRNDPPPG